MPHRFPLHRPTRFPLGVCLWLTLSCPAALAADNPADAPADAISVEGPVRDEQKGVWRYTISSPFLNGPNHLEVLLPDDYDRGRRYQVLYVLPVEPGIGGRYGDGLEEVKKTDAHNRHGLICVTPAFDTWPWYIDHATDPKRRHESYMTEVVAPLIRKRYSTTGKPEGRLLIGFSKSGLGCVTLLLRNPDVFGYAAAWDAPFMLQEKDRERSRISTADGSVERFREYQPPRLFASQARHFQGRARFALLGHKSFGPISHDAPHTDENDHTVATHRLMESLGIPHFYNNRIVVDHTWHSGWVEPAIEALVSLAAKK